MEFHLVTNLKLFIFKLLYCFQHQFLVAVVISLYTRYFLSFLVILTTWNGSNLYHFLTTSNKHTYTFRYPYIHFNIKKEFCFIYFFRWKVFLDRILNLLAFWKPYDVSLIYLSFNYTFTISNSCGLLFFCLIESFLKIFCVRTFLMKTIPATCFK